MSEAAQSAGTTEHHEVIVVGAGFGGIYAVYRLRNQGLDVLLLEAAPDVGGVWYHNAYPGARCDLLSIDYSYSFSEELQQEWNWTQRYSPQGEILAYLRHVTDRFDLRKDMRFNTRVTGMTRDDATNLWTLTTNGGKNYTAHYVVLAIGPLSAPKEPDFPGYADFKDFNFYRLAVETTHLVAGFGRIVSVRRDDLLVDLAGREAIMAGEEGAVSHMNEDHADAIHVYATRLLGLPAASWRMTGFDLEGLDLRAGALRGRLEFPEPLKEKGDLRRVLIDLARQAREAA